MGSTLRKKAIALAAAFALAASLVPASMAFAAGDESSEGGSWFDGVAEFFSPVVTFFTGDDASNDGIETYAAGEQDVVVDADSTNSWQNILQGETPSTKNIGRIWTDKTVLSSDYTLEGALTGQSVAKGDSDFLVGLSALASTSNLKTTTTTTEPLDIVLVLDESGSMAYDFGGGWVETYIEVNPQDVVISTGHIEEAGWFTRYDRAVQDTYGGEYYALVNGEYVRIQEVTNRVYGERNTSYLEHDHWELNGQTVTPEDTQFYRVEEEWQQSTSRRAALQQALYNFIDQAEATNATIADQNSKIRIAIVGFAGNAETHNQLTVVEGNGADQLERTVNRLSTNGATNAGAGMDNARQILENANRTDSNEIVIFFTDGVPTTSNTFNTSVANNAVNNANRIKNNQTNPGTVYSIGIFDNADPDEHEANNQSPESTKANTFMNAVSSNYPSALSWNQLGQRVNDEAAYYKTASDSATLSQIFQDIFDESTENVGSGSPIEEVEHQGADNTPGYLTFTDKLGDYMQVSGDTMTLVFADHIYKGRSTDGGATWKFEGGTIENPNPVYPEGDIADITVTVNKGSDLATGDTVTVSIPASLIPMRNYDVDTETGNITVSDAYPVRVFYGVSLKADAEKALADPSSDEYAAIVAAMGNDKQGDNDTAVEFYSNDWSGDAALGDTTASFTPNSGNRFYYFTENTPLYTDDTFRNRATRSDIESGRTVYYADTYWEQGTNREIQIPVALTAGSPELANADYDAWGGNAYLPVGTQHVSKISGLEIEKGQGNATQTASDVLNPTWGSADSVSQRLGNNGKTTIELPGTLAVTKNVEVAQGSTGPVNQDGESTLGDQSFNFTLTLEGAPQPSEGEQSVTFTGKVMKDGQQQGGDITFSATGGDFSLKDGETLYVYGLSDGMNYTVNETQQPAGFTQTAPVEGDRPTNATGAIAAGGTSTAVFENTYKAEPTDLTGNGITLQAQKVLDGRDWRDTDSFKFDIVANDGAPAPAQDASVVVTDADQNHTKAFGNIEFTAAGTYTYTVTEDNDEDPIAGIDYSGESYTVTINVVDDGQGHLTIPENGVTIQKTADQNGQSLTTPETVDGTVMAFTNIYNATQGTTNINGTKVYENESGANPITDGKFTFQLEALGGYETNGDVSGTYTIPASDVPMPEGVAEGTTVTTTTNTAYSFSFPTIRFDSEDVDHTFEYLVTEVAGTEEGMTYSDQQYTLQIVVTDREDNGQMTVVATPTLTPKQLSFTNTFDPTDVTLTGNTAINGSKILTGRGMLKDEEYTFTLVPTADTANAITAGYITGITADGLSQSVFGAAEDDKTPFKFDPQGGITFNRAGTYTFIMKETTGSLGGMSYDTHECTVTVTVGLDAQNGVLTASVDYGTVGEGDAQRDGNVFINSYTSSMNYSTAGGIDVTKALNGRNMRANEFTFTIDGAASDTVTAEEAEAKLADTDREFQNPQGAANGTAVVMNKLQGLTFTQADAGKTFNYTVQETKGDLAKIDYADEVYTVSIEVVDNNDGTMHTVTTVTDGDQVVSGSVDSTNAGTEGYAAAQAPFVNTYNPDPAVVTEGADTGLKVTKQVNGASTDVDFSFTLKLTSGDATAVTGLDGNSEASATVSEDFAEGDIKEALFGTLSFSKTGTYVFQVTEDLGQDGTDDPAGWTYDTSVETITVNVRNLNSENQYDGVLHAYIEGNNPWFTNTYEAQPVTLDGDTALQVQKTVTGRDSDATFDFTFTPVVDEQTSQEAWGANVETDAADHDWKVSLTGIKVDQPSVADFYGITFKDEGVYKFKVSEVQAHDGFDDPAGWTYDTAEPTVTVTVTDNGQGQLVASVDYGDRGVDTNADDQNDAVGFTNSYNASGSLDGDAEGNLTVTKNYTSNLGDPWTPDDSFGFYLAADMNDQTTATAINNGWITLPDNAGSVDAAGITITDTDTHQASFGDIKFTEDGIYKFIVREIVPGDDDLDTEGVQNAGVTYDTSAKTVTVNVVDNGDGTLTASVDENSDELTFTNTYNVQPIVFRAAYFTLEGNKVLDGRNWEQGDTFTFTMTPGVGTNPDGTEMNADVLTATMPAKTSDTIEPLGNDGSYVSDNTAKFTFTDERWAGGSTVPEDQFTFTQPGTYRYLIQETNPNQAVAGSGILGVTYDQTTYRLEVKVVDKGDGTLEVESYNYSKRVPGEIDFTPIADSSVVTFTNVYNTESIGVTFNAAKVLEGRETPMADNEFQFHMEFAGWKTNDDFDADPSSTEGWQTEGDIAAAAPQAAADANNIIRGDVTFSDVTFTKDHVGNTYRYAITEVIPDDATNEAYEGVTYGQASDEQKAASGWTKNGVAYDGSTKYVTAKVTSQQKEDAQTPGTYIEAVRVETAGEASLNDGATDTTGTFSGDAIFTNVYDAGDTTTGTGSADAKLTKVLKGKAWDGDQFTFQIEKVSFEGDTSEDALNKMPMPTNAADGKLVVSQKTDTDAEGNDFAIFNFDGFTFDTAGTYIYKVTELQGDNGGIDYDTTNEAMVTITVTDNNDGTMTTGVSIKNNVFTNTYKSELDYNDAEAGINIVKTLVGHEMTEFNFTVTPGNAESAAKLGIAADGETLIVKTGSSSADGLSSVGSVAMLDGKGELMFNQGDEGKTYTYTVQEVKPSPVPAGYTYDETVYTVTITTDDDGQGGIKVYTNVKANDGSFDQTFTYDNDDTTDNETAYIPFENSYNATGELGGQGATSIVATKTLTNRPMADGEFHFTVTNVADQSNKVIAEGHNDANGTITFGGISYTTQQMQQDVANGLAQPGAGDNTYVYTYTVAEDTANLDKGVTAITPSFTITVTVTDNGDGTLGFVVGYPENGTSLQFRNAYGESDQGKATVNVHGNKGYKKNGFANAPDINGKFIFTLTGVDEDGNPAPMPEGTVDGKKTATNYNGSVIFGDIVYTMENVFGDTGSQDVTTSAEDGIATMSAERTKIFTYTVTESGTVEGVDNDPEAATGKNFTVTVTDHGNGTLTAKTSPDQDHGLALFGFTNEYNVDPKDSSPTGDGGLTVTKAMTGDRTTVNENEFKFELVDAQGNVVAEGYNDANGKVQLGTVHFTADGEYTYTIREAKGTNPGVDYDGTTYKAIATATDDGKGNLDVTWRLTDAQDVPADQALFTNTYTAEDTSVVLGGSKVLDGRALAEGEFSFQLTDSEGNELGTVKNDAKGGFAFDAITYGEPGTYEYTISEVKGDAEGVTYDDTTYAVKVVVTDNGQGKLQVTGLTYNGKAELPVFTNTYTEPEEPVAPAEDPEEPKFAQTNDSTPWLPIAGVAVVAAAAVAAGAFGLLRTRRR